MIEIKDIKPIPKYILSKIKRMDKLSYPEPNGITRFYKYYTQYKKELCEVVVAVKNRYKKWYCKQVVIHSIHGDKCFLQDISQTMGFYKVGWHREGFTRYAGYSDYDWGWNEDKYFQINAPVINKEYILQLQKYKYSAIDKYPNCNTLKYLRLYEQYPQCELLVKAGLSELATSKMVLKKCAKDKKFCKWLYANKDTITKSYIRYTNSIIRAYNKNKPIQEVYQFDLFMNTFKIKGYFTDIKNMLKPDEYETFMKYIKKQNIDGYLYTDYLKACNELGLDMNIEKNRYPHNFKRWHDIRIDEFHSKQAEIDRKKKEQLYNQFTQVANKYLTLQRNLKDKYITLIAKSPAELINEGEKLHHCVGRMGYDQKFAREETLIFFIRLKDEQKTPLVTVEYSIKKHKVLQCYADHDSKPSEEIENYVYKTWLPYANRKIRQIAI